MRVVVTGATGNVGTSLLDALSADPAVQSITGIARRSPRLGRPKTEFVKADVARDDLAPLFAGADAVIHLAWRIQPAREPKEMWNTNVVGSRRVFDAVRRAGVRKLVYASSVGAYSARVGQDRVDETWPTDGIASSTYSKQKAKVEFLLDELERQNPALKVVRLRPGLIFKRTAAAEIRRYFIGPLVPRRAFQPRFLRFLPAVENMKFQVVHSSDVGEAYRLAVTRDVRGAFNIAAEPVLDARRVAEALGAREVMVPAAALRTAMGLTFRLHLHRTDPGWVDLAMQAPLLDTARAAEELAFAPRYSALQTLNELIRGLRDGAGLDTPPLEATGRRLAA